MVVRLGGEAETGYVIDVHLDGERIVLVLFEALGDVFQNGAVCIDESLQLVEGRLFRIDLTEVGQFGQHQLIY